MAHSAFTCVQSAAIFQGLPDADIETLTTISTHQQLYPKGTILYAPTTLLDQMLIVDSGRVKVYQLNENGKEKLLYMLQPGAIDSEAALFAQRPHYNYAETVEDTRICSISSHDFQQLLHQVPALAFNLLNILGDRLTALESMSALTSNVGSKQRLFMYLQQLSQKQGVDTFELPLKKKELASYLGITPETLSRQFNLLAADKMIEVSGKTIKLSD